MTGSCGLSLSPLAGRGLRREFPEGGLCAPWRPKPKKENNQHRASHIQGPVSEPLLDVGCLVPLIPSGSKRRASSPRPSPPKEEREFQRSHGGSNKFRPIAKPSAAKFGQRESTFRFSGGDTPSAATGVRLTVLSSPCQQPRSRLCHDQARSKRSRFMTLFHAATKSCRNFSWESSEA